MSNTENSSTFEDYKILLRWIITWKEEGNCPFDEMYVWPIVKNGKGYLRIILWWHHSGRTGISLFSDNWLWKMIINDFGFTYNDTDFADNCFVSENIQIQNITASNLMKQIKEFSSKYENSFKELRIFEPEKSSGGCYVATAVYGSYDCPEVWTLRRFRDKTLAETWYGRLFIRFYYAVSPTAVKYFGNMKWFKNLFKKPLDKFVQNLNDKGFENTPYYDRQEETK